VPSTSSPPLEAAAIDAAYGARAALSGVDLVVQPGETWAICGPNGSGKSTLLRVIAGALRPQRGTVRLFGEPLDDRAKAARVMALVPQDTEVAFGFTVAEVVAMGRVPHGRHWRAPTAEDARVVDRELERRVALKVYHHPERDEPHALLGHHYADHERWRDAAAALEAYYRDALRRR